MSRTIHTNKTRVPMHTNKLKDVLKNFRLTNEERMGMLPNYDKSSIHAPESFVKVAESILNGHFLVSSGSESIKVHPSAIEFYYHEEEGTMESHIKDFIVYHRNTKNRPDEPTFPLGILHNHFSGIDITFEHNNSGVVRASVLIREFFIEYGKKKTYLNIKDGIDGRSTYVYRALFSQFSIFDGFSITWEDGFGHNPIEWDRRKNVMQYDAAGNKLLSKPDNRLWHARLKDDTYFSD